MASRNVTADAPDPRTRYSLYRLCECPECGGRGRVVTQVTRTMPKRDRELYGHSGSVGGMTSTTETKCPECRGEGRIRQCVAECETAEAVGVALVTCAREGEWEDCAFGCLDRMPECATCGGDGRVANLQSGTEPCSACKGSGVKPTGTWLLLPWMPSARNVRDAARTLARSKTTNRGGVISL